MPPLSSHDVSRSAGGWTTVPWRQVSIVQSNPSLTGKSVSSASAYVLPSGAQYSCLQSFGVWAVGSVSCVYSHDPALQAHVRQSVSSPQSAAAPQPAQRPLPSQNSVPPAPQGVDVL